MTPVHDGTATVEPRPKRLLWITLSVIVVLLLLGMWRCAREVRASLGFGMIVDTTYSSPQGTNAVRVIITDQGALGYGGISVYRYSVWTGWDELYYYDPAVGLGGTHSVKWLNESVILLKFEDPYASFVEVEVSVEP